MLQRVYPEVAQNAAGQGTESGAAGLSCRYNYDMDSKRTGKAEKEIMKMQIFVDADAVDYKLISICHKGDVVVSQDYGVAAMALGKEAYAIHQSGKWYTNENIDQMLMERHLNKKARRSSHKNHMKGPRKRTEEDDVRFAQSFEKLIQMAKAKEGAQSGII
mgnify:CR=1 FL=1